MRAVDRIVQLLEVLSESDQSVGVVRLADQLGIPASTAHRLLAELAQHHVVVQDGAKRYRLGPGVLPWGAAYTRQNSLLTIAQPHLSALCARTTESVFLTEYVNGDAICVATAESPRPLRFFMHVGQRMPYHAAASARAILAFRPASEAEAALDREALLKFTETTPTTRDAVLEELERVRAAGFAVCAEEMEVGVTAISVPVRNAGGDVIASLSIVAPEQRMTGPHQGTIVGMLLDEASAISAGLGYRPETAEPIERSTVAAGAAQVPA